MELLQRRKLCREFLNGYNEKLHPQIISKVFEIGLLMLKKRFNKLLFSKEELDDIIKDLTGKEYVEIVPLPPLKKLEKLPTPSKKPSQEQLKDFYFNKEKYDAELLKAKILRNKQLYDNTLINQNLTKNQNSSIYPNWWWKSQEEDEIKKEKNNNNIIYNQDNYIHNNIEDYNNFENYDENNNNEEYMNEIGYNEAQFQNFQERENNLFQNQNYTIKKLTMNGNKSNTINNRNIYEYPNEGIYYKKENDISYDTKLLNAKKIPNQIKKDQVQRVKSTKPPSRKNKSFTKSKKLEVPNKKISKKPQNVSQKKNNVKISNIPRYKYTYANGRILRMPEDSNNYINMTMTMPNKY